MQSDGTEERRRKGGAQLSGGEDMRLFVPRNTLLWAKYSSVTLNRVAQAAARVSGSLVLCMQPSCVSLQSCLRLPLS